MVVQPEIKVTNPAMVVNSTNGNDDLKLVPTNFDATTVSDIVNFIIGFKASNNHEFKKPYTNAYKIAYDNVDSLFYYTAVNVKSSSLIYLTGYTTNMVVNLAFTKSGTYVLKEKVLNPLGFVIGNNADQYPNGGEKGGYWYELIGQITSTNTLSLSDSAYDLTRDIAVEEIRNEVILNGINS